MELLGCECTKFALKPTFFQFFLIFFSFLNAIIIIQMPCDISGIYQTTYFFDIWKINICKRKAKRIYFINF